MNPPKQSKYISELSWKRTTSQKQVKITWDKGAQSEEGRKFYAHEHTLEYRDQTFSGTVEVTIDVDAIVRMLASRAANNATGKASWIDGMIKARVIKSTLIEDKVRENPIPKGYSILEETKETAS